ncbi:MAG: 2-succinyl-5-enolpyruvyl-6-hydroxy-3-cyclohexene-1-carboxylic-acid synthase [Acidimicrobiales bacterium]
MSDVAATPPPEEVQATFCATLVDEWVRCGVTSAVVAPGSRSTPLALALAARAEVSVEVHVDERAAGFIALGIGLATGHPAIVLTTSGTATAHLHAAAIEADLARVPLILVTADRPPELQHVAAPQTIGQTRLYGDVVRWFAEPGVAEAATSGTWRSLAARAVAEATTGPAGPGPVHLNLAFREPLVGDAGPLPAGREDASRWHTTVGRRTVLDRVGTERVVSLLDDDRGVIVAGEGCGDPEGVLDLAGATGWPVLADPRSGCRSWAEVGDDSPVVVAAFDPILRSAVAAEHLAPRVVLRLGAPPASKVLAAWLRDVDAVEVTVDAHGRWFDADHRAAHVLHADPTTVCRALACTVGGRHGSEAWAARWRRAESVAQAAIDDAGHRGPAHRAWRGPGDRARAPGRCVVGRVVLDARPRPRVVRRPGARRPRLANRGANGIDGVMSTAVGVAIAGRSTGASTAVLLGDAAFLHDSTALIGIAQREIDLTIVVIDNDGVGSSRSSAGCGAGWGSLRAALRHPARCRPLGAGGGPRPGHGGTGRSGRRRHSDRCQRRRRWRAVGAGGHGSGGQRRAPRAHPRPRGPTPRRRARRLSSQA